MNCLQEGLALCVFLKFLLFKIMADHAMFCACSFRACYHSMKLKIKYRSIGFGRHRQVLVHNYITHTCRAFTALELRKKLHGKRYPLHIIDSVIADVKCKWVFRLLLYLSAFYLAIAIYNYLLASWSWEWVAWLKTFSRKYTSLVINWWTDIA